MRNEYLAIAHVGISGFEIYMRTKNFCYFHFCPDGMNNDYGKTNNMRYHTLKSAQHLKKIIKNERKR